jgi:hypothetical protein
MGEIGFQVETSTVVYCGNQIAIQVVDNHIAHIKMNHTKLHANYCKF